MGKVNFLGKGETLPIHKIPFSFPSDPPLMSTARVNVKMWHAYRSSFRGSLILKIFSSSHTLAIPRINYHFWCRNFCCVVFQNLLSEKITKPFPIKIVAIWKYIYLDWKDRHGSSTRRVGWLTPSLIFRSKAPLWLTFSVGLSVRVKEWK